MLNAIRPLHALGFAIHLLKPKSKAPLEAKWTTGPRKKWPEIRGAYRKGMNVGVRLGTPSNVGGNFLSVIDCDVKSGDPKHQKEMVDALSKLGAVERFPFVASGRGNGSGHFYCVTKQPTSPHRFAQSSHKVKLLMPSEKRPHSRFEKENLTDEEMKKGYRFRPAWEISIMGEGQQVVLPPSIHPDSGKPYVWVKEIQGTGDLPIFEFKPTEEKQDFTEEDQKKFRAVDVDLEKYDLPKFIVDLLCEGVGCDDRSAAAFKCAIHMFRAGMSEDEILSVLTDRDYFLGDLGFEHAQTRNRARAAKWIRRYTLKRAKAESRYDKDFAATAEIAALEAELDEALGAETGEKAGSDNDWRHSLERTGGNDPRVKTTLKNIVTILVNAVGQKVFCFDEFGHKTVVGCETPWETRIGEELSDTLLISIKYWLNDKFRFEPDVKRINEACEHIAHQNHYHPVRDYLNGLKWDGVPRVDTWIKTFLGGKAPEPYLSTISRKVLVAMVARVMDPGCKFDHMLILEGNQDKGKSTSVRILASDNWFTDTVLDLRNKDSVLALKSRWIVEMGELASMNRADVEILKSFITSQNDYVRKPYGMRHENTPRQCIFIGTTNLEHYLKDETGNRRFWPVRITECDQQALRDARDQLFAEAVVYYEKGEPLYLENERVRLQAQNMQGKRTLRDMLQDEVEHFLENPPKEFNPNAFVINALFKEMRSLADQYPAMASIRLDQSGQSRVGRVLKMCGFKNDQRVRKDGMRFRLWVKNDEK